MVHGGLRLRGKRRMQGERENPLLTIVTIVHNGRMHLEQTINSVIHQSLDAVEYIVIDGNSTDGSKEIIMSYDNYIDYWISESDDGIADAFNKGFKYSTGNYIAFLNSDDWYEPEVLTRVAGEINGGNLIYCGHMNLIDQSGDSVFKLHRSMPERINQTMRIAHPSSFTPREVFIRNEGFSPAYRIAMDFDFMLRAKLLGYDFKVLDFVIANHRRGGASSNVLDAIKEEREVKNKNLGNRFNHWSWYYLNFAYFTLQPYFITNVKGKA